MRKIILALSTVSASLLMASQSSMIKMEELKEMNFFKNKGVSIVGESSVGDLTMVSILAQTPRGQEKLSVFITKDKKYVIVGGAYNDKTGEQMIVPVDMSNYVKDAAYTFGTGKKELFVFTDPECPYCIKMEKDVLSKLPENEYNIHVYFYPLPFHRYAESAAYYILSKEKNLEKKEALSLVSKGFTESTLKLMNQYDVSNMRAEQQQAKKDIAEIMSKKSPTPEEYVKVGVLKEKIASLETKVVEKVGKVLYNKLKDQMDIVQSLGITGTPTLLDSKGLPVDWTSLAIKK